MTGFATQSIHGSRRAKEPHGTLRPALYDSAAFDFNTSEEIARAFDGRIYAHSYSRISNPTVAELEERLALLAGARAAVAVSSGMAAISNTLLTLGFSGANVVVPRFLFGNTRALITTTLGPWGLTVKSLDILDLQALEAAIDDETCAVFFESISNPQLEVPDVEAIVSLAHAKGVPVVLDGTATTPYLFKSKDFGVDIEVISSTKYISGGATSIGGVILDNGLFDWKRSRRLKDSAKRFGPLAFIATLRREVFQNLGACLGAHNAWLQLLGLETLALRVDRSTTHALKLAEFLLGRGEVKAVNYPGLEQSASYPTAKKLFHKGFGGILTLSLANAEQCFAFQDALTVIRRATNIHDNKTLIIHPSSTIFHNFSEEEKVKMGVTGELLRLSVGIEDIEDLKEDLERGFAAIAGG
ncbi:MAG: aminotransferase class I/II-fold pyridoxal phosphate-dependent enzyme [Methylobacteriaceae bacterium]|jgi:O-acetylhomoserine (thiol)-lyase|nr:aminotransferase class I/II-fold pyridoxal phosphate-dependent enzyme [Methylobacteriaceae bacterium]